MASQNLKKLSVYIPLWKRTIPKYPLWWKGNPQLRIFLPLFWMKIVKPRTNIPDDHVCFEVHPQMTKYDIKNYLQSIYKVDVASVRTALVPGKERKDEQHGFKIEPESARRIAYVHLAHDQKFEFPDMFKEKPSPEEKQLQALKKHEKQSSKDKLKHWDKQHIAQWFR